jgi:hypothetical protein
VRLACGGAVLYGFLVRVDVRSRAARATIAFVALVAFACVSLFSSHSWPNGPESRSHRVVVASLVHVARLTKPRPFAAPQLEEGGQRRGVEPDALSPFVGDLLPEEREPVAVPRVALSELLGRELPARTQPSACTFAAARSRAPPVGT